VFWTYGFPLLMALALGFAFQPRPLPPVPIAVVVDATSPPWLEALQREPRLVVQVLPRPVAAHRHGRGDVDLLVHSVDGQPVLRSHPERVEAELARLLCERALRRGAGGPPEAFAVEAETRPGARYIDFLIPGLLGLNLLGAGMWGVGYNLVQMRTQQLLRRLAVAPMRRAEFLLGYLAGRFVLVVPEAVAIVVFGALLFDVPMRGSWLALGALVVVGGFLFSALGFLLAARVRTIEGIGGLMNLVQLPMWLLGGVYFSVDRIDGLVRWFAECLPLTHLNRALRDVMLAPGTLADVAMPLLGLGGGAVLCFGVGLWWFRWK
jgi:ABC-type multidrug transport system permease subunit